MATTLVLLVVLSLVGVSLQYPSLGSDDYREILSILENRYFGDKRPEPQYMNSLYDEDEDENAWQPKPRPQPYNPNMADLYNDNDDDVITDVQDDCDGKLEVVDEWPQSELRLGQIGGVDVGADGHPSVFHRADRTWEADTFNSNHTYAKLEEGPIMDPAILKLNKTDGSVIAKWGDSLFYLPHGLTIDEEGNYWLTDVAMHQVFKFEPGTDQPALTLGKAFEPAHSNRDTERFCKPTDVAVASNGDIYVADGYCASRIVKFNAAGEFQGIIGEGDFWIPHSVALAEDLGLLCVADRENMSIACYNLDGPEAGRLVRLYSDDNLGRVFAISYVPAEGRLYAVTGRTGDLEAEGFTIDLAENDSCQSDFLGAWSPFDKGFDQPHDLAVSPSGDAVYVGEIGPNNLWKFTQNGKN